MALGEGDSLAQDISSHPGAMMSFNNQDRQCVVTPPRSEGSLSTGRSFPFAEFPLERSEGLRASAHALSMTGPVLMVKNHHRAATPL